MYETDKLFSKYFNRIVSKCKTKEQLNNNFTYECLYINLKVFVSKDISETDYCNLVIAVKNIWNCIKDNI